MRTESQSPEAPLARPVRIFLVDDQVIIRRGLSVLFGTEPDLLVCGEAGKAAEAMSKITQTQPELAVVDLFLEAGDTLDLITELRKRFPGLGILVFSMQREPAYVVRAMRAGADNYIPKDEGPLRIVHAIRKLVRERESKRSTIGMDIHGCEINPGNALRVSDASLPAPNLLT